jgi:hypothetical protein
MSIAQQSQSNTITRNLRVSGKDEDVIANIHQVMEEAFEKNKTIQSVTFYRHFLGCLRNDARSKLMKSPGRISSPQEDHLEDALLMVPYVAELRVQANTVLTLLKKIVLQGVKEHFDACEIALYQHGSVKEYRMDCCILPALEDISLESLELAGKKQEACPAAMTA